MKNKQFPSKIGWTTEEENFIKYEKQQKKVKGWKTICKQLNEAFPERQRTGKQCRERYMNFIAYSEQQRLKRDWVPEQDELLFQKVIYFGTQWSKIIAFLPSRSENNAKNRFYGIMRKISRRITGIEQEMGIKTKKPITFQALIKYFENGQNGNDNSSMENGITPFCIFQIKSKFLEFVTTHDPEINETILKELINHMHQFNIRNNLKRDEKIQLNQSLQKAHRAKHQLNQSRCGYTENASLAQPELIIFYDKNNRSENINMDSNNRMQNQNFEIEDVQYSFNQDQLQQDYPFKFEKD